MIKIKDDMIRECRILLVISGIFLLFFLISLIVDHVAPGCNLHLQFPDRVYDLLYLYPWQEELYSNLFLMGSLIVPFFFLYRRMMQISKGVFGIRSMVVEKPGERRTGLFQRLGLCLLDSLVFCLALFLENALFFLIVKNDLMRELAWGFFYRMLAIEWIYMVIAFFVAACAEELEICEDVNLIILLFPYVMARMHSLIRFFSDQIVASNRKLKQPELVETWIRRLTSLQVLSPVTWSTPGISYPVWYWVCAVSLAVILGVAAISMFTDN